MHPTEAREPLHESKLMSHVRFFARFLARLLARLVRRLTLSGQPLLLPERLAKRGGHDLCRACNFVLQRRPSLLSTHIHHTTDTSRYNVT